MEAKHDPPSPTDQRNLLSHQHHRRQGRLPPMFILVRGNNLYIIPCDFFRQPLCFLCHFFSKFCRYCSNYYRELADPIEVCDWCQSEGRNSKHGNSSSKSMRTDEVRSAYSSGKIKHDREERTEKVGKSPTSTPSPRTATRRYKLLKDVM